MKKIFFLFTMLANIIASAQRTIPVAVANTSVDYSTKIVTFDLSWKGSDATHRDEVWIFVDIQPITGANTLGAWSPATLVPNATTVTAGSGNQYSALTHTVESGNTRGVWVKGTSSVATNTFSATVKVTLDNGTPAKFNACAYATDYPPNAVSYSSGTYMLRGTQPFTIIGNGTIQDGNKYVGTVINSMTDLTGCPGGVGRDEVHNGGTCAPGLMAVSIYCRDLVADEATVLSCAAVTDGVLEIKLYDAGKTITWNPNTLCPSGWRWPTIAELKCMQLVHEQLNLEYPPNNYGYWSSQSGCTGADIQCVTSDCAIAWKFVGNYCGCLGTTCPGGKSYAQRRISDGMMSVRCVR